MSDEMRHIHKLADEIGPRPAGTNEEQLAATYIADEFKRRGLRAQVEEFSFTSPSAVQWATVICYVLTVLAALISNVNTALSVIAFILAILGFGLLCLERSERGIISNLGDKRGMSQNVVAHYVPQGDARRRPERPVVIVAHYDSQRNALQGMPALVNYYPMMRTAALAGCASVAAVCLLQALPFGFSDGGHTAIWVIGLICAIPAAAGIVATLVRQFALRFADGANDNASGVTALLGVAERVMGITPISAPLPKAKPVEDVQASDESDAADASGDPDVTQLWTPGQVAQAAKDGNEAVDANADARARAYQGPSQETAEQPAIVVEDGQVTSAAGSEGASIQEPEPEPYDPAEARIRRHTKDEILASGVIPEGVRFVMTPEAAQSAERAARRAQAAERAARAMVREAQQATDSSAAQTAAEGGPEPGAQERSAEGEAEAPVADAAAQQERVQDVVSTQGYFASHPTRVPGQQPDPSLLDGDAAEARLHAQAARVAERRRREAAAAREQVATQQEDTEEVPTWWTRSEQAAEQHEASREGGSRPVRRSRFADMPVEGTFAAAARAAQQRAAESRRSAAEAREKDVSQPSQDEEVAEPQATVAAAAPEQLESQPSQRTDIREDVAAQDDAGRRYEQTAAGQTPSAAQEPVADAEPAAAADVPDSHVQAHVNGDADHRELARAARPVEAELVSGETVEAVEAAESDDDSAAEPNDGAQQSTYGAAREQDEIASASPTAQQPAQVDSQSQSEEPAAQAEAQPDSAAPVEVAAVEDDDSWPTPVEPTPANPMAIDDFERRTLSPEEQQAQEAARRDAAARLEQARRVQQAEERATAQAEAERRAVIQAEALRRAHEADVARRKAAVDREADEELGRIISVDGRPHRDGHQSTLSSQIDALKGAGNRASHVDVDAPKAASKPSTASQQGPRRGSQQSGLQMPDSAFLPSTNPDELYASIDVAEDPGTKTGVAVPQPISNPSKSARMRRIGSIAQPDSTGAQDVLDFGSGTAVRSSHHAQPVVADAAKSPNQEASADRGDYPTQGQEQASHGDSASLDDSLSSAPLPSDSAQLRRLRLGALASEDVDTEAPIQGTGTFAPVGDPYATGGVFGGEIIDDADDVAGYGGDGSGELPASSRVDIPESRAHRFFDRLSDRFSRHKKKPADDESLNEWLGVDDDYNARDEGREIGSWDNFEEDDDSWDASRDERQDDEADGRDWKGGGATTGYRNGQSYDPNADANRPTQDVRSRPRRGQVVPNEAGERAQGQQGAQPSRAAGAYGRGEERGDARRPRDERGGREREARHQRGARRHPAGGNSAGQQHQRQNGRQSAPRNVPRGGSQHMTEARPARLDARHDARDERAVLEAPAEREHEARQQIREQDAADQRRRGKSAARARAQRNQQRKLREQVQARAESDLFNREVWFVAAGASGAGHIGDREFIDAHADKIKGAIVINVECVGAGQLTCIVEEGLSRAYKADSRDISMIARAAKRLNIPMRPGKQNWRTTDATPFYDRDMRAISIMGLEGTAPAGWCWGQDASDEVDAQTMVEAADVIAQAIMSREKRENED